MDRDLPGITSTSEDPAPNALPARAMLSGFNPRSLLSAIPALAITGNAMGRFIVVAVVGFAVVGGLARFVHWRRFRWGFDGRVLHVHSGLLWRSRRAVDVARIQQVELERPLLHRVMGTALLRVETAADAGETEVALNGLPMETATALQQSIARTRRSGSRSSAATAAPGVSAPAGPDTVTAVATSAPPAPSVTLFRPSLGDLVRHAVTGRALLVLPATLLAFLQFAGDVDLVGNDIGDQVGSAAGRAAGVGIAIGVLFLVGIGLLVAVATTLVRDWDLKLVRIGDDFRLSRGLLDQRSATVPMQRLQVLHYQQNWLRALFGVGTLQLHSAGGGGEEERRITVPWMSRDDVVRVLAMGLDRVLEDDDDLPLVGRSHPPAARRRLWFQWLRGWWMPVIGIAVAPAILWPDRRTTLAWTVVGLLVLTGAISWVLAAAQYRRLGHAASDRVLLVTNGVLGHESTWMPLGRLQGVDARANPFQRRLDLVTVVLSPAGGANRPVEVRDVATDRATELGRHFVAVASGRLGPVDHVGMAGSRTEPSAGPPMAPA